MNGRRSIIDGTIIMFGGRNDRFALFPNSLLTKPVYSQIGERYADDIGIHVWDILKENN